MTDYTYSCNCPDFTKRASKNPNAQSLSEQVDRNWSNSDAGVDPGKFCKHIWAAILAEGKLDEFPIPIDVAIADPPQPSTQIRPERLQSIRRRGHYFGV
ncbi:hypothetical protein [Chroococcidiopsis sp.]|uniref:hypothetical protein n=1 Tax=Chroococcidiopsis sp. TaxID=3088168 RepID=UPI003F2D397E